MWEERYRLLSDWLMPSHVACELGTGKAFKMLSCGHLCVQRLCVVGTSDSCYLQGHA